MFKILPPFQVNAFLCTGNSTVLYDIYTLSLPLRVMCESGRCYTVEMGSSRTQATMFMPMTSSLIYVLNNSLLYTLSSDPLLVYM